MGVAVANFPLFFFLLIFILPVSMGRTSTSTSSSRASALRWIRTSLRPILATGCPILKQGPGDLDQRHHVLPSNPRPHLRHLCQSARQDRWDHGCAVHHNAFSRRVAIVVSEAVKSWTLGMHSKMVELGERVVIGLLGAYWLIGVIVG